MKRTQRKKNCKNEDRKHMENNNKRRENKLVGKRGILFERKQSKQTKKDKPLTSRDSLI